MSQKNILNSPELAKAIKCRRTELNLTIEEAAQKAGVGTKTWSRYEAGESIRKDKGRGICKALNWRTLPDQGEDDDKFQIEEYLQHEAYSTFLAEFLGPLSAVSFTIGSDILLDYMNEDINALSSLPRGSHLGELSASFLSFVLPEQFLMNYNYEFLYLLRSRVLYFRNVAHAGGQMIAHSVLDELTLYLIMEESRLLMESMDYSGTEFQDNHDDWDDWAFVIFDDSDLLILYSNTYLDETHPYHFSNWQKNQFYS